MLVPGDLLNAKYNIPLYDVTVGDRFTLNFNKSADVNKAIVFIGPHPVHVSICLVLYEGVVYLAWEKSIIQLCK